MSPPPLSSADPLLLVEDDAAHRTLYRDVLQAAGLSVVEADDRRSARAALDARAFPV
ncbi:MAG: sigma-54-dependent Fis family transcriptional regulator, partial [Deltaproteobacteria bacterium]